MVRAVVKALFPNGSIDSCQDDRLIDTLSESRAPIRMMCPCLSSTYRVDNKNMVTQNYVLLTGQLLP